MGELIPIFGLIAGTVMTVGLIFGVVKLMQGPVGVALARRIQGKHGAVDEDLHAEVTWLRDQVDQLRQEVTETQERLDFAERLLTRGSEASRAPEAN